LPGEPPLDEETQKFISQSLTDVDLFASYGLTQKAIGLLEAILRRAPRHTPTLEKLLDFVLGAGDDRRTAELAAQLEQIHHTTGDKRSAERFGELRRRFQRAAGLSDEDLAIATAAAMPALKETSVAETHEVTIPEVPAEPAAEGATASPVQGAESAPVEVNASPSPEVQEVDLSDEWATLLKESHHGEAKAETPASKPAKGTPEPPSRPEPAPVEEFSISGEPPAVPPAKVSSKAPPIPLEPEPLAGTSGKTAAANRAKGVPASGKPQKPAKSDEPEFEVAQDFELVLEPEPLVPAYDQKPPEAPVTQNAASVPPAGGGFDSDEFLADLAKEIDQLGMDKLSPALSGTTPNAQPAAKPKATSAPSAESGPLKEVFDEFRAELGEMGAEEEDLETHYNLGIAFREMGLLEEAISEFQKVAKANERGRAFRYTMQCCTLLGLAFMEKGQPAIAAIWYERALKTPGMDPESTLALRYDLGVAQESAGEPEAALKSFSQVYAMNIDYRDVAERIAALQKPIRRS